METINVRIINNSHHPLPAYETHDSAGMDIRAYLPDGPVKLRPMQRTLIPTGLRMELPQGFECQIRPRSGLALRHGITVLNTPGTIDADYRGEIKIILINLGDEDFVINDGERVCQMIINRYAHVDWILAETLDASKRGDGGFGSTGVK